MELLYWGALPWDTEKPPYLPTVSSILTELDIRQVAIAEKDIVLLDAGGVLYSLSLDDGKVVQPEVCTYIIILLLYFPLFINTTQI